MIRAKLRDATVRKRSFCDERFPAIQRSLTVASLISVWLLLPVLGCEKKSPPPPPPPPAVSFTHPVQRSVVDWDSYTGYLSSPQTASVVARVSGLIVESPFREGSMVHAGDTLFIIDPRPFQADLDNKKAAVAQAKAQADQAAVHFQRYQKLQGTDAISQDDYDTAKAGAAVGKSGLVAAQAALETSQLNLEWSRVTAPISGRISHMNVTVGNLVNGGSGQTTLLTTIVSTDPLYFYIQVPDQAYLKYQTLLNLESHSQQPDAPAAQIPCYLDIQSHAPLRGHLDFIDNAVDPATGTLQVRAVIDNPGWLLPGLYGNLRIPEGPAHSAILIPDSAVVIQQNQRSVLLVGDDNVVQIKSVQFGPAFGPLRSVLSGLTEKDRVIVDGLQSARPGAKVTPQEVPISPDDLKEFDELQKNPANRPATQPASPSSQNATAPAATEGAE